jgi:Domain of unknown function (DUF4375)
VLPAQQAGCARFGQYALVLTRRALEEADDVVYLVIDELIRLVNAVPLDEQLNLVRRLSPGMRMIWGVFVVDMEVNNGGFNQFFWNSSHEYVQEASEGFRVIGAHEQAQLLDEAVARFREHADALKEFYERGTIEAFSGSYEPDVFGDLDRRYCELDSAPLQVAYIRAHPEEFTSDLS